MRALRTLLTASSSLVVSIGATPIARAQTTTPTSPVEASGGTTSTEVTEQRHEATEGEVSAGSAAKVTPFGYVEAAWQWSFNRPSNGVTNYRGFDNRTGFTLDNVVLGASFEHQNVVGKISFQVGHTPATYYLAEPTSPGTSGAASTDATYWRFLQEAHVGWKAPIGDGLLIEGGLFLSPIGVEGMAIKDQWNWSRSNLFFGLPFYHVGARATYPLTSKLSATLAAYNGWNSVVDDNDDKSVSAQLAWSSEKVSASFLYFGGNERPRGAPEGSPWRHLWDAWVTVLPTDRLGFTAHGDVGFEKNAFGTSSWYAGAIYARVKMVDWLFVAGRADYFHETVARSDAGAATPIFWPSSWVGSETLTLDFRPQDLVSIRLEYRHDQSAAPMFFRGDVQGDGTTTPFVPNARAQNTMTVGMTAWF